MNHGYTRHGPRVCLLPPSTGVLETRTSKVLPCAHCSPPSLARPPAQKPGDAEALLGNTLTQKPAGGLGGMGWGDGSFCRHGDGRGRHQPQ